MKTTAASLLAIASIFAACPVTNLNAAGCSVISRSPVPH